MSYTSQPASGATIPGCGGTLYGTRGVLTALGFPGNYSRYSDCTWTLRYGSVVARIMETMRQPYWDDQMYCFAIYPSH